MNSRLFVDGQSSHFISKLLLSAPTTLGKRKNSNQNDESFIVCKVRKGLPTFNVSTFTNVLIYLFILSLICYHK